MQNNWLRINIQRKVIEFLQRGKQSHFLTQERLEILAKNVDRKDMLKSQTEKLFSKLLLVKTFNRHFVGGLLKEFIHNDINSKYELFLS